MHANNLRKLIVACYGCNKFGQHTSIPKSAQTRNSRVIQPQTYTFALKYILLNYITLERNLRVVCGVLRCELRIRSWHSKL